MFREWAPEGRSLPSKHLHKSACVQMILSNQEFIPSEAFQAVLVEERFRKVSLVVGDDHVRAGLYGGCQYVAILWIVPHPRNEILVPGNQRILKREVHGGCSPFDLVGGITELR